MKRYKISTDIVVKFIFSLIASTILFSSINSNLFAQQGAKPKWWGLTQISVPDFENPRREYFYIRNIYLMPAYQAEDIDRVRLFRKSIIAFTNLLKRRSEHIKEHKALFCLIQFYIGEAYLQLEEIEFAKDAYRKCVSYSKYLAKTPTGRSDQTTLGIIEDARFRLNQLE